MTSIKENFEEWNNDWDANLTGDEWTDQAEYCNQPYPEWKESLVKTFIENYIDKHSTVLEIGPGHGRFTEYLVKTAYKVILLDISPNCLDICRNRFPNHTNIKYVLNNGKSLEGIDDSSIDLVWSYDSFVFMEEDVYEAYFKEFRRILKPHGLAIIHHPGRYDFSLGLVKTLMKFGKVWRRISRIISKFNNSVGDGGRSLISVNLVKKIASKNNLRIVRQVDSWGEGNKYNCKEFKDAISIISKM